MGWCKIVVGEVVESYGVVAELMSIRHVCWYRCKDKLV